jgi:hypothetical protein
MPNEEEVILFYAKSAAFTLCMLSIGVIFGPEWSIILLLSAIFMKKV